MQTDRESFAVGFRLPTLTTSLARSAKNGQGGKEEENAAGW
jgi:hypothetical protein